MGRNFSERMFACSRGVDRSKSCNLAGLRRLELRDIEAEDEK
jgi:hypothetical protein